MPKFAANLTMLWTELDPYARFRAAAEAGFRWVEFLFPDRLDADQLRATLDECELELVLFDLVLGDRERKEQGILCLPGREDAFMQTLRDALALAPRLGTTRLNALAGTVPPELDREVAEATVLRNLRAAEPLCAAAGVTLLLEPLNSVERGRVFLSTPEQAIPIIEAIGSPHIQLQLDQYHVGMMGGDPVADVTTYQRYIKHVQIADAPGRHQPGTGGQPIAAFLSALDESGYEGFVGLEYIPRGTTEESLAWLPREQRGR